MDVDSIELGVDFVDVLQRSLTACKATIVVIGTDWTNAADGRGNRRLDDPNDFVRLEVETALSRNIRVIPVLVRDAGMPSSSELPSSMAALLRRNGIKVSHAILDRTFRSSSALFERILAE